MRKVCFFVKDFFEKADILNKKYTIISQDQSKIILHKLYDNFFKKVSFVEVESTDMITLSCEDLDFTKILAAHLPSATSRDNPLLDISTPIDKEAYFMFEQEYYPNLIKFENINALSQVVDQSYNFNYLIFDKEASYIVAWDSYETLFGGGVARDWVEKIKKIGCKLCLLF
ncbi:hypothetical protein [Acinetobacter pollinis]|uniref:Uncharacterized protein n=1 Tax=Acinetobacter pollinis TaxID=2605270 RepID=A0ABU6DUI8_9GAMM|nr:hypothetical protein [Acinetobacter pollinis]MEB5477519.1 hypothetical protein [Acinetobacter pollinis]